MDIKNCIIIHGCPSPDKIDKAMDPERRTYDKHWLPWTKAELEKQGIPTECPLMPHPWAPVYEDHKQEFEKCGISDKTVLVGTSCGSAFLVRWLGETKQKASKLIMVAPMKKPHTQNETVEQFYDFPIDESIKGRVGQIIMFTADNEKDMGRESLAIYHQALGGEIISIPGYGHYMEKYMGTREFPELIQAVLK